MADSTGTTVWRWDQAEPFGSNPADEDPDANSVTFDLPLRLPGQRYDAETTLHYNWRRYYDPNVARYLSGDPISVGDHAEIRMASVAPTRASGDAFVRVAKQLAQMGVAFEAIGGLTAERARPGYNPYTYVLNNPLLWVDTMGLLNPGEGKGRGDGGGPHLCPLVAESVIGHVYHFGPALILIVYYCVYDCNIGCPGTPDNLITEIQWTFPPLLGCNKSTPRPPGK